MYAVDPGPGLPARRARRGVLLSALVAVVVAALLVVVTGATVGFLPLGARQLVALSDRPGDLGATTEATEESLDRFWTEHLPRTYHKRFTNLRGGWQPKSPDSPPFTCGEARQTYRDVRGNAFYCPAGDYIAWDAALLFPQLDQHFGTVSPAIVLAHEMGHAIQNRASVQAPSIVIELQADCFAGSWIRWADSSNRDSVDVQGRALDTAVAALLTLRDQPGTPVTNPQAHGLGFDRVNAFQTGYDQGTGRCAEFPSRGVVTTELPFRTVKETLAGGNLPYDVAIPLFGQTLDAFWRASLPELWAGKAFAAPRRLALPAAPLPACPRAGAYDVRDTIGYCPDTGTVAWVDPLLRQLHATGDFVTGTVLSEVWARAGQYQGGRPAEGKDAGLERDCLTGAWVATLGSSNVAALVLSPGDLDEVLATILASSFNPRVDPASRGTAFERTQALRKGVLGGLPACR
jgi:predicted metalloprotease